MNRSYKMVKYFRAFLLIGGICTAFLDSAMAGGTSESVKIESFSRSGSSYILKFKPSTPGASNLFQNCTIVEVRGSYSSLHSWLGFPKWVTEEGHLKALDYLEAASTKGGGVNFGEVGTGLEPINDDNLCLLASRALSLDSSDEKVGVMSFYRYI